MVRLSSLGDLVILSSALEYLHRQNVKIYLAVYEQFSELYEKDPRIEKVIAIRRNFWGKLKGLIEIRRYSFDLVLDLHRKFYPFLISLLAIAKHRSHIVKNSLDRILAVRFKKKIEEKPLFISFVEPAFPFFASREVPFPTLVSMEQPEYHLPEKYAVIVPGASKRTKMWPHEYYVSLGKRIYSRFHIPLIVIGKENLITENPEGFINLSRQTNLRQLLYILSNAEFVVSNDTGPAHMTAAVGTPLFVIFGPTVPEFGFRPKGKGYVKVFEKTLPCRPCSLHGTERCPAKHFRCMLEIKPEEVFNEIERFYTRKVDSNF